MGALKDAPKGRENLEKASPQLHLSRLGSVHISGEVLLALFHLSQAQLPLDLADSLESLQPLRNVPFPPAVFQFRFN